MVSKSVHKLVTIGVLSAIIVALQVALAALPNVELVTVLMLVYTLVLPLSSSLLITAIFATLEMLIWGSGDWVVGYFWIWPIWVLLVASLKHHFKQSAYRWALLSGLWGALFGILFSLNHGLFYGFKFSLAYWIRGIPFDVIHTLANYLTTLVLFKPTYHVLKQLIAKQYE